MFSWFRRKQLADYLNATKSIKVCGFKFKIKKVDPMATLDGSKVLQKQYDTYEGAAKSEKTPVTVNPDKIKSYFRDMFMACVVEPKLYRDKDEAKEKNGIWVDNLFTEWEMVEGLHTAILEYTYGKKKLKLPGLRGRT